MRHLLSPPISDSVAAKREWLLSSADHLVHLAEKNELKSISLRACICPIKARKGNAAANMAIFQRGRAREFIALATDLTDYTEPLDRERESWILLATLQEDAARRAPHPVVVRPRKR